MKQVRSLLNHPVARSIGGVGAAAAIGQALTLAATPVLTRLYDQEAFGAFGLFFGVANILATIVMLGLNDAIIAADDEPRAWALARACGVMALSLTIPAVLLIATLRGYGLFGLAAMPTGALWLLLLEVPVLCALSIVQASLVRARAFAGIAQGHLALGATRAGAQIGAGLLLGGFVGLATGEIASRLFAGAVMGFSLAALLHGGRQNERVAITSVLRQFRHFILFRTPSTVLGAIAVVAPTFVMAAVFDLRQAGYFSLMYATVLAPMGFVQKAVGDVFLGHFAKQRRSDLRAATRFFWKTVMGLVALAAVVVLIFTFFAPDLFRIVFGPKWVPSGAMAVASVPLIFATLVVVPVSQVVNAINRPHLKLYFDFANLAMLGMATVIGYWLNLDPVSFVGLMAWSISAAYVLFMLLIANAGGLPEPAKDRSGGAPQDDVIPT